NRRRIEELRVWIDANKRAGCPLPTRPDNLEFLCHVTIREDDAMHLAIALHLHLEAPRKRIGHGHANAVQPAREGVGAIADLLVELSTCVEAREHYFDGGDLFFGVRPHRDAATVVLNTDRLIGVHPDVDARGKAGKRLVGSVVDDFVDDVSGIAGPRVHARPLAYRLEALEDAIRLFFVSPLSPRRFPSLLRSGPSIRSADAFDCQEHTLAALSIARLDDARLRAPGEQALGSRVGS